MTKVVFVGVAPLEGAEALAARHLDRAGEESGQMVAEADDAAVVIALRLRLARASRRERHDLAVGVHGDRRQRFARRGLPPPVPPLPRRPGRARAPFGPRARLPGGPCWLWRGRPPLSPPAR